MLSKNTIKEISFEVYPELIKYANDNFAHLKSRGISIEELVNEAIVNIFDVTKEFKDKSELVKFLKNSIKGNGFEEQKLLKDKKISDMFEKISLPVSESPDVHFIHAYEMFEKSRFGESGDKKCPRCGGVSCIKFTDNTKSKSEKFMCRSCRHHYTITSGTYLTNLKLTYVKVYRIIRILCINPNITCSSLGNYLKISHNTAWNRKILIKSAIKTIKSQDSNDVLRFLLSPQKDNPIDWIDTGKRKLSDEDVADIRRMKMDLGYSFKKLAQMYNIDPSGLRRIYFGLLYKKKQKSPKYSNSNSGIPVKIKSNLTVINY